jgi:hypothetical protein
MFPFFYSIHRIVLRYVSEQQSSLRSQVSPFLGLSSELINARLFVLNCDFVGHGTCEATNPTNTTFRCVCNDGWTHRGDMFSLPAGADCITSNLARLIIHIIGYVLNALIMMLLMVRMVQLRPFELGPILKGSTHIKYLIPKRFCLLQCFQSGCTSLLALP